jgi:TonB family protein
MIHWNEIVPRASRTIRYTTFGVAIALLPALSGADETEWPQSLYLTGITVSAEIKTAAAGKTLQKRELGRCDILLWVTADGRVRLSQVIRSTGHAKLDQTCLSAAAGKAMAPARDASGPIDSWAILPVTFEAMMNGEPKAPEPFSPSAPLAPNQTVHVKDSDYPKGALERGEQGDSWVHVDVSDSGGVLGLDITKSSGSSELDQAAIAAIGSARFSPAYRDHVPVKSSTEVVVSWILPAASPQPH